MQKNQFLSKLNKPDYNNILEEVLEEKPFTADVKSLLLSMLYKIETSYNDYSKVKRTVMERNEFIEQIISTIKYCCEQIRLVEPNSEKGKEMNGKIAVIEKNEIIAFPTEFALLNAIAQKIPLDFAIDSILEAEIEKILQIGYMVDTTEIVYDFDGWTWNNSAISEYALLYQNIEILLGHDFIEQWKIGKKDIKKAKERILNLYNGENQLLLVEEFTKVIAKAFVNDFPNKAKDYIKQLEELRTEYKKINNTTEYLNQISTQKKLLNEKIREIDKTLLDKEVLKQEYDKENEQRPLEKKIFSIRHYGELLKKEKNELLQQINECNEAIKPAACVEKKEKLKEQIEKYEIIETALNEKRAFLQLVIGFQKTFLKVLETKIEKATTKKELIDIIYTLRYYKNIKLEKHIKDIPEIKGNIEVFERTLLLKAVNSDVFCKLTDNSLYAVEILSKILDTNIIDLEEINILPKVKDNIIELEVYDGEILDTSIDLNPDIKVIQLKPNKRTKLFN